MDLARIIRDAALVVSGALLGYYLTCHEVGVWRAERNLYRARWYECLVQRGQYEDACNLSAQIAATDCRIDRLNDRLQQVLLRTVK